MIDKKYYIKNIALKNFKCFDNQKYYIFEFGKNASPIILSGPNGFGKTTFFDAIELMLSNNITRFNKDIEYSNTNLEANILVNSEDQPAYIILTLVNDKMEELQILGRVDNEYKNIDISKSLTYYQVDNIINFNKCNLDIDEEIFIEKYCKKINIEYIEKMLKYKMDKFNIKYYLSQEDSIHYLKENIKQRNANLGSFLNIYEEKDILSFIEKINTKTSAIGNGIIGRAEKNCKDNLDLKIEKLKKLKSDSKKSEDIKYKDIFPKKLKGETENFSFNEELDIGDNIDMKLSETWKEELLKLRTLIGNWDYYKNKFVKKDKYKKIKKVFTKENLEYYTLDIFNNCGYISDLTNHEDYKILEEKYLLVKNTEAIVSLIKNKEVNKAILINEFKFLNEIHNFDFNIDSIESELDGIIEKESLLGSEAKLIKDIREKRINLKNSFEKYGNDNNTCPYCATEFESMEELLEKFNDYESELTKLAGISSQKFETKKDELIKQIKEKFEDEFLETIDSSHQNKSQIYFEYEKIENIINNAKLKEDLDFINDNINKLEVLKIDNFDQMDKEDKISLIEKKIEEINGNLESLNNELESYKLIYSCKLQ